MSLEQTKPQADIDSGSDTDRQRAVKRLYLKPENYGHILDTAESDRRLLKEDAERIAQGVAKYLPEYDGPIQDEAFQAWASDIIQPAVERMARFYDLQREYEKVAFKAIWRIVEKSPDLREHDDPKRTVQQIADDFWLWCFLHLDELLIPGTAKLSTRLYSAARWQARAWRTRRLRERNRYADVDLERIGRDERGELFIEPEDYEAELQTA